MYPGKFKVEVRGLRQQRLQNKMVQLLFVGGVAYLLGISTVLYVLVK